MLDPDQIPKGWGYAKVGDLGCADEQAVLTGPFGSNLGRDDFRQGGIPVLTIGCLTTSGIDVSNAMFVSSDKARELGRYRLRENDLLFSRMASVGRSGIVSKSLVGALFNYHIMRLRLNLELVDPRVFHAWVTGAGEVRAYIDEVNHGGTRDGINTDQLMEMPVLLPPVPEQRRIVAKLDALQSRTRLAREALAAIPVLLDHYRQSVLAAAFRGELTAAWRSSNAKRTSVAAALASIEVPPRPARYGSRSEVVSQGDYALAVGDPQTHLLHLLLVVSARTMVYDDTVPVVARNPRVLSVGGRRAVGRLL